MAFEFIGRALRGATDILGGLVDEVGNGRANREDDVRKVRRTFGVLGRMVEPEDEPGGFIDRALDTAILGFQRDKGLRVDGFMGPGGPTERSLQDDLRGLLSQQRAGFGSARGDGLGGLGRGRDRFGSGGRFEPALALQDDRDPGRDEERTLALGGLDDPHSGGERVAKARGGGRLGRLDLGSGRGDVRALASGSEPDRSGARTAQLRDEEPVGGSRNLPITAEQEPSEPEPARLKPALDKIERNLRRTVEGWREQGRTDAAHHLEHFLDGSGERITYNRDQARSFNPVRNAEEDAQRQLQEKVLERARGLKDGESREIEETVTGEHGLIRHGFDLLRGLFGDTDRLDDNLATGRTTVKSAFKGTISRNEDETSVDGIVDHDWSDDYNFDRSRFGLPQPGAAAARSLEQYRGAKTFTFGSKWRQSLSGGIGPRSLSENWRVKGGRAERGVVDQQA